MQDTQREVPCAPVELPAGIAAVLAGYEWARNTAGESGGQVHRLRRRGTPDLYLKHGKDAVADDIAAEMARLRWLNGRVPVPEVVRFVRVHDEAWLVTTAIGGQTAWQVLAAHAGGREAVVDALAAFLRRLHAIPADSCPFANGHAARLAKARERIDAGLVDEDDFDDERQGWTAEQVWEALQSRLPLSPDPVVTHGDYSLDNLLLRDGEVVGCIDVGRAGIADRWQDLAIAWHNLAEFGEALQQRFLAQYGIGAPDRAKLDFHLLLDELF